MVYPARRPLKNTAAHLQSQVEKAVAAQIVHRVKTQVTTLSCMVAVRRVLATEAVAMVIHRVLRAQVVAHRAVVVLAAADPLVAAVAEIK